MKRRSSTVLLAALILGLILPMACAPKAEEKKAGLGNSNANIANMGMSVADGDWIYFLNAKEDGALYKMKKDGTEEALISKDQAGFLNVMAGYIYYCNATEGSKIFRIKPDGTERALISDFASSYLMTDGEWLYAIDNTKTDDPALTQRLHRSKLDGTGRTQLGQAAVAQYNLAGDAIYYIAAEDSSLHRMKTDGTEDAVIGDVKPKTIIASGDKIYFTDSSSEANQIWSLGTDGTGAIRLSEDKTTAINVSGDWIYYGHPTDEMLSFEFKKMKLDGSEPSVVNGDSPMVITVHDDLLGYLQMDFSTFSMSQVFVKTDGTGRKEFKLAPDNTVPGSTVPGNTDPGSTNPGSTNPSSSGEEPGNEDGKIYQKNERVAGHGMTVTVDRLYATNFLAAERDQAERFFRSEVEDYFMIITFTVTNDGEKPLEMHERVGIVANNSKDGGEYTLWANLADVTDRMKAGMDTEYLKEQLYLDSLVIQPKETRILQTMARLEVRSFPVNFSLFDGQRAYASILIEPDEQLWAIKPDAAMKIIQKWFVGRDLEIIAQESDLSKDGTGYQLFYPFMVGDLGVKAQYFLVNGFTQEIYSGEKKAGKIVPLEIVEGPPKEEPPVEEPSGDPITYETGEKVKAVDMTVMVNSVYGTDVWKNMGGETNVEKQDIGTYLFINFTVTSESDIPLELEGRFGVLEVIKEKDGGTSETGWNVRLADITGRVEEISKDRYLPQDEYERTLTVKPGKTMEIQATCGIRGRVFPVLFTLWGERGKDFAYIRITPDPVEYFEE